MQSEVRAIDRLGDWIGGGWNLVIKGGNIWKFTLLGLAYFIITIGISFFISLLLPQSEIDETMNPLLTIISIFNRSLWQGMLIGLVTWPLTGLVEGAIFAVILNLVRTGRFELGSIEKIGEVFWPLVLMGLVRNLFVQIGMLLCCIPGLLVTMLYLFPALLIVDKKISFWEAMEESRKKVLKDFWGFVVLFLAFWGINIVGVMACGVGMLITIGIQWCAVALAYMQLWPKAEPAEAPAEEAEPAV